MGSSLRTAVNGYATPQARDFRSGQTSRWKNDYRSRNLNDQIGGQLNPDWVEWLMGFPDGWTNPDKDVEHPAPPEEGALWPEEPEGVPRVAPGTDDRADRIKCLGNAVVPHQFFPFFRAIADIEGGRV